MIKTFYSHGKLLITGEYLVLDGAKALAIPTQRGQWLTVTERDESTLQWISKDENDSVWLQCEFQIIDDQLELNDESPQNEATNTLLKLLETAKKFNPKFLSKGCTVETKLEFNRSWGLGSSSTLINNIAQWAKIDPYKLLDEAFGGSGYDIACAQHNTPIVYCRKLEKPKVVPVVFDPVFKDQLYFVYLNQKQDSKDAIKRYQSLSLKNYESAEKRINEITEEILSCTEISSFESLITEHEDIISNIIKIPTVKSNRFPDYPRSIKSLGGWGGDFILVVAHTDQLSYFKEKSYHTIISFDEMIFTVNQD